MDARMCFVCLAVLLKQTTLIEAGAMLNVRLIDYSNPKETDSDGEGCDIAGGCDYFFEFCVGTGSDMQLNSRTCPYLLRTTGEFDDSPKVTFSTSMKGINNPLEVKFERWPGSVVFKVKVWDDDSWDAHDLVDTFYVTLATTPILKEINALYQRRTIRGRRSQDKTTLRFNFRVYCEDDYYGSECSTYCVPHDDSTGHYDCDRSTGEKLCHEGWLGSHCDVKQPYCQATSCKNGALCTEGASSFICECTPGYTGLDCSEEVDECASSPCEQGGTCEDLVNGFECKCPDHYRGVRCEEHVCETIDCQNGGKCKDGQCKCARGYEGMFCDVKMKKPPHREDENAVYVSSNEGQIDQRGSMIMVGSLPYWVVVLVCVTVLVVLLVSLIIFFVVRRSRRKKRAAAEAPPASPEVRTDFDNPMYDDAASSAFAQGLPPGLPPPYTAMPEHEYSDLAFSPMNGRIEQKKALDENGAPVYDSPRPQGNSYATPPPAKPVPEPQYDVPPSRDNADAESAYSVPPLPRRSYREED